MSHERDDIFGGGNAAYGDAVTQFSHKEKVIPPGPSTDIGLGVISPHALEDESATVATAPAASKRWCPYVSGSEPFANNLYPISAIAFDPVHELLWSGNESVHSILLVFHLLR